MTTIAADASLGIMCSDSCWSDGIEKAPIRKVWRIKGRLCGFAGDLDEIMLVRWWMTRGMRGDKPPVENVQVLAMGDKSLFSWTPVDGWIEVPRRYAIGSGGMPARAAMAAGKSPAEAVAIAREIDAGTHGKTRTYRLQKGTSAQGS
jgi:hypothetical protein